MLNHLIMLADAVGGSSAAGAAQGPAPAPNPIMQYGPFYLLIFAAFYFLLIRPQQKQKKEQQKLLSEIKTGDKVVTASGIHGTVANAKDKTFTLRLAEGKMEIDKASVVRVTEKGSGSGAEG